MQPSAVPSSLPAPSTSFQTRSRARVVLVASSDSSLRERLRQSLTGLRWQVIEAPGGAEAWMVAQNATQLEALLIDSWLPDLDVQEFLRDFRREHPQVDLTLTDGSSVPESSRSPYHQELLYALRRSQDGDTAAWHSAPAFATSFKESSDPSQLLALPRGLPSASSTGNENSWLSSPSIHSAQPATGADFASSLSGFVARRGEKGTLQEDIPLTLAGTVSDDAPPRVNRIVERIPELIGSTSVMLEVSRRIRLVAARSTPVLIEGPTGTGKELVAEALHRLSTRCRKPFVAINCAAIPEALLEAELFGHTRGAFTGAVQGRTGRIESADGGTLFLDEIGEMPLALQSKLLRFFESGELQRIGDNETVKVDVRIVTATHQHLAEDAQKGRFRPDLYYRLAVFLIRTPSLMEHMEDLPQLVAYFLERMGRKSPVKRIELAAIIQLSGHEWPGNVRELEHVLERAAILAGDEPVITAAEIDFGLSPVA